MQGLRLIVTSLLVAACIGVQAAPMYPLATQQQASAPSAQTPDTVLRDGIRRVSEYLNGDPGDDEAIRAFLDREVAANFDFDTMARLAAGQWFRRMTPAQRTRFTEKLAGLFLNALARNLGAQMRPVPTVDLFPARIGRVASQVVVPGRIVPQEGFAIPIEFRFHRRQDGWKVFDVAASGASAVSFYRRYFTDVVRRAGLSVLYD